MKFKLTKLAQRLRAELESGDELTEVAQRFQDGISHSDDFWYMLTQGWDVIDPILADEAQKQKLLKAVKLISEFEDLYYELACEM